MITESKEDIFELEQIHNIMIHDMADQLTTKYYGQSWIINYYFEKAKQKLKGEKPVMKVMISLPMNGRKTDEIKERIKELKEKFAKYHIEVVDSFLTEEANTNLRNQSVFYLGRTIQNFLSDVDAVYFDDGWQKARGCKIERYICEEYDIMILDDSFFKQENEVHIKRQFGIDKIQIMPYKNENQKYGVEISNLNRDFGPDTYNHIPRIDGLEDQDEDNI